MIQRHAKMLWLRLGFPSDDAMPNDSTAKTTIIFVGNYSDFPNNCKLPTVTVLEHAFEQYGIVQDCWVYLSWPPA